ncbi:MAG: PepSY domain-containing protein [Bacteroidetes bacterium]|nr:PepSY domain-containing protein [Bacteroidota bacterium]
MENVQAKRKQQAKTLRVFRKWHRTTGALLFAFFFIVAVSGLLLGWKNNSGGTILPDTQRGESRDLVDWLPLEDLALLAQTTLKDSVSASLSTSIDRMDVRPDKGVVKVLFKEHYWEVQLDGSTGAVKSVAKRYSDFFEDIHDGSILDDSLNTPWKIIKLIYTSVLGVALLIFTITGFWLWYGPKRMRKNQRS